MFKRLINYCTSLFGMIVCFVGIAVLYVDINTLCLKISYVYNSFIAFMEQLDNNIYFRTYVSVGTFFLLATLVVCLIIEIVNHMDD